MSVRVEGVEEALANLGKQIRGIKGRTRQGVEAGAQLVSRKSDEVVPIDTGSLRGSREVHSGETAGEPWAAIVYNADYALYVHEDLEARHLPGRQAKYLEAPLRRNQRSVRNLIADYASVK